MKKKSSIVKLVIIGVIIVIGLVLSFCTFNVGLSTYNSFASSINLGLDLKGGVYAVYQADTSGDNVEDRMNATRRSLMSLLSAKGYSEATVTREGSDKFRVEVPDIENPEYILEILGEPADVRFVLQSTQETILTGEHVASANPGYYLGKPVVVLVFNEEGRKIFAEETTNNTGGTIDIITTIAGESSTTSITVNDPITDGQAVISSASYEAAEKLANQIMSGTFGVTLSLLESSTISAFLGETALKWILIAGIVGLVLVLALLGYLYRLFGAISAINLIIYAVAMLFFLAVFPWIQLTLPGIAGILLGIGIAIDGNVITFERIKDEFRNGKSITASYHYGFRGSFRPILEGSIAMLIVSIILVLFPTGMIRSFATALIAGLFVSLICSLFITRKLVKYFLAICDSRPELYGLARSKEHAGLKADQTAEGVQKQIDDEIKEKARIAKEKETEKSLENGGLQGEIV